MGFWIISLIHFILVCRILTTNSSADSTFSPVITSNNASLQPLQTVSIQNNAASQINPVTLLINDSQTTSTSKPAINNSPQTIDNTRSSILKPATIVELPKVSTIRFSPVIEQTQPFTIHRQALTTEIPTIATTQAPSTSSQFTSVPLSTESSSISLNSFNATVAPTESTRNPPSTNTPKRPTIINILTNVSTPTNNTTANNSSPLKPVILANIRTSTSPKPAILGPQIQTLTPQKSRPKDTRCSNNSDCNNGLCFDNKCYCSPGYSGLRCQIVVNECASNPCFNNATCLSRNGDFECKCLPGYRGEFCESEINMCQDNPCANNATCVNYLSKYECRCQDGFKGDHCETNIDDCYSKPCLNNGTCIDGVNKYTCDCRSTGYKGDHCETNIDDCESKPCFPTAVRCIDLVNGFKCECHDGFTGTHCEIDVKECEKAPCLNGGTCVEKSQNLHSGIDPYQSNFNYSQFAGYSCECLEEYQGINCDEKKKCYVKSHAELCSKPSAQCLDNIDGSYDCQINASFDGTDQHHVEYSLIKDYKQFKLEEIKVKYKSVKGGVILGFVTQQSSFVELQLNATGLYLNGSSVELSKNAEDLLDGKEREFHVGLHLTDIDQIHLAHSLSEHSPFKGCLMQVKLNNHFLPFYNYGDEANHIFNITHSNYDSEHCLVCFENDCLNNGQCDAFSDGFSCTCPPTFTGMHCEEDIDECSRTPCSHGQCENTIGGYQCSCDAGYSGKDCDNISDYCLAIRPCQQRGICKTNESSSYTCECPSSHIGKHCERERTCFNECNDKNSQCIQNRTCACLPSINHRMMDAMCEVIDSCDKHDGLLCRNGGTCSNLKGSIGYECICPEGFHGLICELQVPRTHDVILLVVITCIGLLLATCAVVSLIIFKSVRRARATQGTYSPQTEEIYGERMFADTILKVPPTERLI